MQSHKAIPWRRARYKAHLDEADALRQEIADESELDRRSHGCSSGAGLALPAESGADRLKIFEGVSVLT
jgi:hypothetical protein